MSKLAKVAGDADGIAEYSTKIPNEERLKWIQLFHGYDIAVPWNDRNPLPGRDFESLLALGDDDTGHWLEEQYQRGVARNEPDQRLLELLTNWRTAEGIKFMASLTFSNEAYRLDILGGDVPVEPASFLATSFFLHRLLPKVPLLPDNVRKWAAGLEHEHVLAYDAIHMARDLANIGEDAVSEMFLTYREREIAQQWWRANEQAIMSKRWIDVKAGENFHDAKLNAVFERLKTGHPPGLTSTPASKVMRNAATPAPDVPSDQTAQPIGVPSVQVWPWFAGIAALILGVALAMKQRKFPR